MVIKRTKKEKSRIRQLGKKIEKLRLKAGDTQIALAKKLGYRTSDSIALIESGRVTGLDIILLERVARAYGTTVPDILDK